MTDRKINNRQKNVQKAVWYKHTLVFFITTPSYIHFWVHSSHVDDMLIHWCGHIVKKKTNIILCSWAYTHVINIFFVAKNYAPRGVGMIVNLEEQRRKMKNPHGYEYTTNLKFSFMTFDIFYDFIIIMTYIIQYTYMICIIMIMTSVHLHIDIIPYWAVLFYYYEDSASFPRARALHLRVIISRNGEHQVANTIPRQSSYL